MIRVILKFDNRGFQNMKETIFVSKKSGKIKNNEDYQNQITQPNTSDSLLVLLLS
jgi:hypothetical protein